MTSGRRRHPKTHESESLKSTASENDDSNSVGQKSVVERCGVDI